MNEQVGYTISLPQTLIDLGRVERALGDLDSAQEHLQSCLKLSRLGLTEVVREQIRVPIPFENREHYQHCVDLLRKNLSPGQFGEAWLAGRAADLMGVVDSLNLK